MYSSNKYLRGRLLSPHCNADAVMRGSSTQRRERCRLGIPVRPTCPVLPAALALPGFRLCAVCNLTSCFLLCYSPLLSDLISAHRFGHNLVKEICQTLVLTKDVMLGICKCHVGIPQFAITRRSSCCAIQHDLKYCSVFVSYAQCTMHSETAIHRVYESLLGTCKSCTPTKPLSEKKLLDLAVFVRAR